MKLRHPNPGDTEALLVLSRAMHVEGWYRDFDYDEATVRRLLETCQSNDDFLALVAVAESGEIIGFFCAAVSEHFFGRDKYACDLALYVVPAQRGSMTAVRFIRAYEAWCRIKGVKEIHIGVSTDIQADRTGSFFQRLGFESFTRGYRKKCVSGSEPRA